MSTKIKFKTPTKETKSLQYPLNNEDIQRLGWTRISLADKECDRLKEKKVEVSKPTRICNVVGLFTWPL